MVSAAVVLIGDEILSGRTVDKNLAYLAGLLGGKGIQIAEARVVKDDEDAIVKALTELRHENDYVITTGGIGPTHDDITTAAIAKAFKVRLVRNAHIVRLLTAGGDSKSQNRARLKMANIPEGAKLVENRLTGASGFYIDNVYALAGVPEIMRAMAQAMLPNLKGGEVVRSAELSFDCAESAIAAELAKVQSAHRRVAIGSYPRYFGGKKRGVNVVARCSDEGLLAEAVAAIGRIRPQV